MAKKKSGSNEKKNSLQKENFRTESKRGSEE